MGNVLTQSVQHQRVRLHQADGLLQRAGQAGDAVRLPGGLVHGVDVLGDLSRGRQALLNAVQAGGQAHGEGQVGVAGRVGGAQLHTGGLAPGGGDADEGGAVGGGPGQIAGSLVAGHQPLVGVDQWVGDGGHAGHVAQQAGDEAVRLPGQAPLVVGVVEHIFAVPEQGHVGVHAGAGHAEDGLGHKGGVEAVFLSDGLDRQLEGHDVVGGVEGLGVLEVNLVLALGALVVAGLNLKVHLLQGHTDLPAGGLAVVQGAQVKVARLVVGLGGGLALVVGLEQEKLCLRAHVEGIKAHVMGLLDGPLQHVPGIAHKGGAVGVVHVADEPGHLAVAGPPGEHAEGPQVGVEILIGLVDTDKAVNGGAVEHALVVDGLLNLGGGDGHVFQLAENVRELEADKLDVLLPDNANDVFLRVKVGHGARPLSSSKNHVSVFRRKKALRSPEGRNAFVLSQWFEYKHFGAGCQWFGSSSPCRADTRANSTAEFMHPSDSGTPLPRRFPLTYYHTCGPVGNRQNHRLFPSDVRCFRFC